MLRWTALASILALCAVDAAYCDEPASAFSLPARKHLASFEIVMGRVKIAHARCGQCRSEEGEELADGRGEFLSVNARGKAVTLRYEAIFEDRRLTVDFTAADEVEITAQRMGAADSHTVRFRQPPRGKVQLTIERSGEVDELCAADVWQLILAYPDHCRQYLIPHLETLRPDWKIEWQAQRIEEELTYAARSLPMGRRERLTELVGQLGAEDFAVRQSAYRRLREMGQPALAHLQRIAPHSITAEQRFRVRELIEELTIDKGDTPRRAALLLGESPSVWIALMSHADSEVRQLAAERLAQICGDKIEFDAAAARERRESQLADVRRQFEAE